MRNSNSDEPVAVVTPTIAPTAASTIVDTWFDRYIRGSVVAQDTQAWNHMIKVVAELKKMLPA